MPAETSSDQPSLDPTDLSPVLSPEGWALLNRLSAEGSYREADALSLSTRLRKDGHAPELVSAVLTQLRLRGKAEAKFGPFAQSMVLTQAGLEQATRLQVAALHAGRFAGAGVRHVADLGCGLGADSMALAALDLQVTAVERDPTVAAAATVNLMPFPTAQVVCADAVEWARQPEGPDGAGGPDGFWLDPARRVLSSSGSSRVFDPEVFSPPLSFVEQLADSGVAVGVKMGPGIPHGAVPAGCEAQWVSVGGEVTEAVLWFNAVARPNVRRAALVLGSGPDPASPAEITSPQDFGDSHAAEVAGVGGVGGWLYEPDGAVIRAGLVADLVAREFGGVRGRLLDEHIAYFCADEQVETPFARAYEVLTVMPYHVKSLRRWVKDTGVTRLDIKKRGMAVTPEEARRLLMSGQKGKGAGAGRHTTLVLTRVGQERLAIEVRPV
ncbi:SAM-dependent methyltransferase [Micrococcus sp. IITD107]|uniref:class I SAM-dependent methyltransferase n=1 Tax=Micrococcus sp. IITD107 TaxID=3342790 RepID=UPI0035B79BB7